MAFFGMQLKPGKAYNVGIPETKRLHVTGACLASGNGKAAVSVMVEGKNFTVACLNSENPMCSLDLTFGHGQTLAFTLTGDDVHVSGCFELDADQYFTQRMAGGEFGDDEELDEEFTEEDDEVLQEAIAQLTRQKEEEEAKQSKATKSKGKKEKSKRDEESNDKQKKSSKKTKRQKR